MMTVKRIERAWNAGAYQRLFRDLAMCRPEAALESQSEQGWEVPAAAMAIIWLEELSQTYVPLYGKLIRSLIAAQQPDGGWGDVATTALALRALLCDNGDGLAVQGGLDFLTRLQRPGGIWPSFPHHRLPEDPQASAILLYHLGDQSAFQAAVRMHDATAWFERNGDTLDRPVADLWRRASRRCRLALAA
jgi:hypothetical protein